MLEIIKDIRIIDSKILRSFIQFCDAIKQNEFEIMHVTFLDFFMVESDIFNVT